jgi:hypothetical protein
MRRRDLLKLTAGAAMLSRISRGRNVNARSNSSRFLT